MSMNAKQLRQVIKAALDCHTHFYKPTVINNDPDFSMGEPMVIMPVLRRAYEESANLAR